MQSFQLSDCALGEPCLMPLQNLDVAHRFSLSLRYSYKHNAFKDNTRNAHNPTHSIVWITSYNIDPNTS
jgi:hypothetical protein